MVNFDSQIVVPITIRWHCSLCLFVLFIIMYVYERETPLILILAYTAFTCLFTGAEHEVCLPFQRQLVEVYEVRLAVSYGRLHAVGCFRL